MKKLFLFGILIVMLASCSKQSTGNKYVYTVTSDRAVTPVETAERIIPVEAPRTVGPVAGIPNATAFRMSGDYENNVAITMNSKGELIYFPDPSDITADSKPIALGNGWWLNRQGFGQHSVFTSYTFAEYAALPEVPSPEQLKNSVIPGAKVTDFIELPVKLNESSSNLPFIKEYLNGR